MIAYDLGVEMNEDLPFRPFNQRGEIERTSNRLVHWEQGGRAYFVTFRLADSLPGELLSKWDVERAHWLQSHPVPWTLDEEAAFHRRFSLRIERALDEGHGACLLRSPEHSVIVGKVLDFFDGDRYQQLAWVVMPNHVHALFVPTEGWTLERILHSWKSYSAKQINVSLQMSGPLWQKDYFDRLIRDESHFRNCVRYIRRNPIKAGLHSGEFLHWESALARGVD